MESIIFERGRSDRFRKVHIISIRLRRGVAAAVVAAAEAREYGFTEGDEDTE